MPELALLDLNPDKLFEKHNIQEVEAIEKAINNEVERKKEELRTLVGERYRDLIEAADTISEMKLLSIEVIDDIDKMIMEMASLQKKHQLPYKPSVYLKESFTTPSISDSIAAQISTLIELPELIWMSIKSKEYLRAAQLFLFGRHIKTGFNVEKTLQDFIPQIPVLDHQWSTILHFKDIILNTVEKDLKEINLSPKEGGQCLVSIALLQDTKLVDKFLQLRTDAINEILNDDNDCKNVKENIINSCISIVNTLTVLQHCFLGTNDISRGLLVEILNSVTSHNNKPVYLLEQNIKLKYLPQIVLQFRFNNTNIKMPNTGDIDILVNKWILQIKEIVSRKGKLLLENITSLQSLNDFRNDSVRSNFEWAHLLSTFHVNDKFELWDGIYEVLITERARDLLTIYYDDLYQGIVECIAHALIDDDENNKKNATDLRWFVWKESSEDLNLFNKSPHCKGLLLKSKGITPKVTDICLPFQTKLETLYINLTNLYSADDVLNKDNSNLRKHQQSVCLNLLYKLKEHIRCLIDDKETIDEARLTILARFLQAVPDLCPTLQKCLILGEDKGSCWHEAKTLFHNESLYCWEIWIDQVVNRIGKRIPEMLKKPTMYADLLNMIPQWNIIWIEEGGHLEGGQEDKHKSQLKIPSAPSFPLQSLLHYITTDISRAHISRLLRENLMHKLLPNIFNCYDSNTFLCQAELLQYLFDIKYLSCQFIPITNKQLNTLAQQKIQQIKKQIDPIDLEVYLPLIKANVKAALHKMQGIYGMTYSTDESVTNSMKISDDPCILAVSKSANDVWFPMLPVTNPSNVPLHIVKPEVIKQEKQNVNVDVDITKNTSSSTSTSFFSDWFS